MIEFQADCGHIIRADDHQAGQIVKCAYCGREVEVPLPMGEDPDLLFEEVDLDELARNEGHRTVTGMAIRGKETRAAPPTRVVQAAPATRESHSPPSFKPILVAVYGIIALVVIVLMSQSFMGRRDGTESASHPQTASRNTPAVDRNNTRPATVPPVHRSLPTADDTTDRTIDTVASRQPQTTPPTGNQTNTVPADPRTPQTYRGLLGQDLTRYKQGVYVHNVPRRARVYVAPADRTTAAHGSEEWYTGQARAPLNREPGAYRVSVLQPLTAPGMHFELQDWADNSAFDGETVPARLLCRDASFRSRIVALDSGGRWIAREYDVEVKRRDWCLIAPLFNPPVSVQDLVRILPRREHYEIDRDDAVELLKFEQIPDADHNAILDGLLRIGQVVYDHPDGHHRIVEAGLLDGLIQIRLAPQPQDDIDDDVTAAARSSRPNPWGDNKRNTAQPGTVTNPGTRSSNQNASDDPQPAATGARSPWDRARRSRSSAAPPQAVVNQLVARVAELQRAAANGQTPAASALRADLLLSDWPKAPPATRLAWLQLVPETVAGQLIAELGQAMLHDTDLGVRLALLEILTNTGQRSVVGFIDRRLQTLAGATGGADVSQEHDALQAARNRLLGTGTNKKNPWDR